MPRYTRFVAVSRATRPTCRFERTLKSEGFLRIAGVDEVGRGSLAGPVVAAAVVLPDHPHLEQLLEGVRDSKTLSARDRETLFDTILTIGAMTSIGWASHHQIDRLGIAAANRRAMARAVLGLPCIPDALLVDHFRVPECEVHQVSVTKGDTLSLSIASASIVAKVVRDRWMAHYDRRFPGYGFARNKGYGTSEHFGALERLGPTPVHRRSFAPVAVWCL